MTVAARTCTTAISSPYMDSWLDVKSINRVILAMSNWTKVFSKEHKSKDEVESSFNDYLDGYFNSFDFYPVCTRQVFARNDAYALWSDFMKVADDLSFSTENMITYPERFMALGKISGEELEKRKSKAAINGLKKIARKTTAAGVTDD
jgi:hypothetical protein